MSVEYIFSIAGVFTVAQMKQVVVHYTQTKYHYTQTMQS